MHISEFGGLLLVFILTFLTYDVRGDEADVQIVSSGYCSNAVLKKKGVDPSKYVNKIIFDAKKITTIPKKPTVPGCFRLIARNITITDPMVQATGEFEMRITGDGDQSKPVLQCKKRQPKCGCGEKDTCMYCDFCKNFKKLVKEGKVNGKDVNSEPGTNSCDCNVHKGSYDIDVEVCTPDEKELGENVPTEVINSVVDGKDFSLTTTLSIYNFRFNSLASADNSPAGAAALKARKARGLVACYIITSNVSM